MHILVEKFLLRLSFSEELHSDQGKQFELTIINEVSSTELLHVTYNQMPGGTVLAFVHNTSVHSSMGCMPRFLMFGCQARLPVHLASNFHKSAGVL